MRVYAPYIAVVIFLMIVTPLGFFFLEMKTNYEIETNDSMSDLFEENYGDVYTLANEVGEKHQQSGMLANIADVGRQGWLTLKSIWGSVGLVKDIINKAATILNINALYVNWFIAACVVVIAVTLAYAVFGRQQ